MQSVSLSYDGRFPVIAYKLCMRTMIKNVTGQMRTRFMYRRIIGHDRSPSWALAHEIGINSNYLHQTHQVVSGYTSGDRALAMLYRLSRVEEERKMKLGFERIKRKCMSDSDAEESVDVAFNRLQSAFERAGFQSNIPNLDSKFVVDLVSRNLYGMCELTRLVDAVCMLFLEQASVADNSVRRWYDSVDMLSFEDESSVIYALVCVIEEGATEMANVNLILKRSAYQEYAKVYERKCLEKELKGVRFGFTRTVKWLESDTVLDAYKKLLVELSLSNSNKVRENQLPETLVMDLGRLTSIRKDIRRLAITSSLSVLITSILHSKGFTVDDEKLLERVDCEYMDSNRYGAVSSLTAYVISKVGGSEDGVRRALLSCYDSRIDGLRSVKTRRLVDSLMYGVEDYMGTPSCVKGDMYSELRGRIHHLYWYSLQIYGNFYHCIFCSKLK